MAAAAMPYTIQMEMRENAPGVTDDRRRAHYVNTCGEWKITKDFKIFRRAAPRTEIKKGFIAQLVQKATTVTRKNGAGEITLTTSEEIAAMTNQKTKYMTFSYIELFVYDRGQWEADQFTNGPVVPFDRRGPWCVDTSDPAERNYHTKGTINMVGTVIYIPENARFDPASEGFARPTSTRNDNPANGLLWHAADDALWARMMRMRGSDPYYHRVRVQWEYPDRLCASVTTLRQTCDGGVEFTPEIVSAPNCPGRAGGGRRRGRQTRRRRRTRVTS